MSQMGKSAINAPKKCHALFEWPLSAPKERKRPSTNQMAAEKGRGRKKKRGSICLINKNNIYST